MTADAALDRLVAWNDLDELVREVDRRTAGGDWDGLVRLRDRCRAALERGLQLWPAASLAEYRLALHAPGPYAAAVVGEGAGRFALGPLAEVAASTHRWAELAPHLADGPQAGIVAHERVVRGEDLSGEPVPFADVLSVPLSIQPWEPEWPLATYADDKVDAPRPQLPSLARVGLPPAGEPVDDDDADAALRAVVQPWVAQSNGRVQVAVVERTAAAAIAALGVATARLAELPAAEALAQLAWAGASGGAHGRRRGAATGRHLAWAVAAALAGVDPPDLEADALAALRWYAWDDNLPELGWSLRLAADHPGEGMAWAIAASDVAEG